ncbi:CHAT domain-containing protein [Flaviramulus basaltis]|uniref:CHAT domain-containing protein n=1 Tax=Flaviramulus basaltis TaxID=369401 RepID=A0A1K2IMX8_9FLAO|nr:CHAT domain-containing protein [Flaviramulus basaltis]SFZ93027.1 CHAT domain-containing protein [Flaviramulus basaltis]
MNYSKLVLFLLALLVTFHSFGQTRKQLKIWENHLETGIEFLDNNNNQDALIELNKAYSIAQEIFLNNEEEFGEAVYYLAVTHDSIGNYKKAIPLYVEALNNLKLNGLSNDIDYNDLARLGEIYMLVNEYANSINFFLEALKIIETIDGNYDSKYASILSKLSLSYKKLADYENAIESIISYNTIIEKLYGAESEIYLIGLTSLSEIYIAIGQYDKAAIILDNVLRQLKNIDSKGEAYIKAIITKAYLYNNKFEYEKEIPLYHEVKRISEKGKSAYVSANNNLGVAYQKMGDYENALKIALEVANNTSEEDPNHPVRYQNLAYNYGELGELDKSLENYEIALESCKSKFGTNHPQYAQLMDCIGQLYERKGDLARAKDLFKETLTVFLNNFDENHNQYGFYLNNYTRVLLKLNQNEEAIDLMIKNIKISEANSNTDNIDYYRKQLNLANAYNKIGSYNEATAILVKYSEKTKQILGNTHPEYGNMLKSLGESYLGLGELDKTIPVIDSLNNVIISQLDKVFKFRSENEKKSFLKITNQNFDELQSIMFQLDKPIGRLAEINLDNQLMLKGLLLSNSKNLLNKLSSLDNPEINNDIIRYRSIKNELSGNISLPNQERDSLENLINLKESELVKLYSSHFDDAISFGQSWKKPQSKLNKNEVAIEFSHFQNFKGSKFSDSILYVAYVFKKDWKYPKIVPLFEEKQLKLILSRKSPNQLYVSRGSKAKSRVNTKAIYDLIWKPLEEYIENSNTIYFAPSGLLNQISFAALGKEKEKPICYKYDLFQLSSTSVLANKTIEPSFSNALLIGGIDYDYIISSDDNENLIQQPYFNQQGAINIRSNKNRGESWTKLDGALKEVETLKTILNHNGSQVYKWSGAEASETNFKKLSGKSPNILHIATHGFFYENIKSENQESLITSTENKYRLADDPLLRSGLIFAGANYAWNNTEKAIYGDDGILTAMEISNMDLSNTDIVLLSACETGLGDIDGSEGVYGLQRAFKMAGVDIIVMSLWEVPDIETAEFMELFYKNWIQNKKVKEAFNITQRIMQTKYSNEAEKWAAFVMFE